MIRTVEFKRVNIKEYLSNSILKCTNWRVSTRLNFMIHKSHMNLQFARARELKESGYHLKVQVKNIRTCEITKSIDIDDSIRNLIVKACELK